MKHWFRRNTVIAAIGSIAFPLFALAYIASLPGKGSVGAVLVQVALVIGGLILSILFLSRLIEQMNSARLGRWIESDEGKEWLEALADDEREAFFANWQRLK